MNNNLFPILFIIFSFLLFYIMHILFKLVEDTYTNKSEFFKSLIPFYLWVEMFFHAIKSLYNHYKQLE